MVYGCFDKADEDEIAFTVVGIVSLPAWWWCRGGGVFTVSHSTGKSKFGLLIFFFFVLISSCVRQHCGRFATMAYTYTHPRLLVVTS
jgi:hypothetical protein